MPPEDALHPDESARGAPRESVDTVVAGARLEDAIGEAIEVGKPFSPHPAQFRKSSMRDMQRATKAQVKLDQGRYRLDGIDGLVVVSSNAGGKMASADQRREQADAAYNLRQILASAKYLGPEQHRKHNPMIQLVHRLASLMSYGERNVLVMVTVRELRNQANADPNVRHKLSQVEAWDAGQV